MSITYRLTSLFAGATFVILLLISLLLHWRLASTLQSEDETILRENMEALLTAWRQSASVRSSLIQEIALEGEVSRQEPYYARALFGEETVFTTSLMSEILPHAVFGEALSLGDEPSVVRWHSPEGRTYLLYAVYAESEDDEPGTWFETALDVTHDVELLRRYRRDLIAGVLIGTLLAALGGSFTARRGLMPLERMNTSIQRITAGRLDQRVGGSEWPGELAELAAAFDSMLERLESSFTRLSRFSADLAHELRTPLTVLRGEAEVVLNQARGEEEYRAVLESSLEEYERLATLVDRLLFLARADAGAAALRPQSLDVLHEISAVCDFYGPLAEEKGIQLSCTGTGTVTADSILFRRSIANLVANALEHTPSGESVTVTGMTGADGIRVRVSDTGIGIPADHLPNVYDRFYQVDPARERKGAGAGLGLSLVRTIARLHGGSIHLESTPGKGTVATLHFPPESARRTMTTV